MVVMIWAVPNILFGPNSRPNRLFVFGRIILLKVHRIWIVIHLRCSTVTPG